MEHGAKKTDVGAKALWSFFSSMKTAVVLLLLLAAISILGTIKRLGMTDLYSSIWYILLLGLISINLAVCSINRFSVTWRHARRIQQEQNASLIGRLGIWGPYLTHLSILVIFAGAILGSRLGFEGYTTIVEGEYTETCLLKDSGQEKNLGFRVMLRKFTIEHDENRNPTGYKSDLVIFNGGKTAAKKIIDVNHPLTYKGVSFFQSDYGLDCIVLKITAPNGETAWIPFSIDTQDGPDGKQYDVETLKQVRVGGKKLTIFIHNFAPDYVGGEQVNASFMPINPAAQIVLNDQFPEYKGLIAWSNLGWFKKSDSKKYKGFTVTMEEIADYTGLQVVKNPGLPIIYAGFGMMLVGVFISFYLAQGHKKME